MSGWDADLLPANKTKATETKPWTIRTDSEVHVADLEARLEALPHSTGDGGSGATTAAQTSKYGFDSYQMEVEGLTEEGECLIQQEGSDGDESDGGVEDEDDERRDEQQPLLAEGGQETAGSGICLRYTAPLHKLRPSEKEVNDPSDTVKAPSQTHAVIAGVASRRMNFRKSTFSVRQSDRPSTIKHRTQNLFFEESKKKVQSLTTAVVPKDTASKDERKEEHGKTKSRDKDNEKE
ncbi:hypothetical protein HDU77_007987 [Chytriomyces hyalinus]|nr:hypothetical protein HDU77_007987 [Chytriomyces hyalinus]